VPDRQIRTVDSSGASTSSTGTNGSGSRDGRAGGAVEKGDAGQTTLPVVEEVGESNGSVGGRSRGSSTGGEKEVERLRGS
jgi:hypothetical protein